MMKHDSTKTSEITGRMQERLADLAEQMRSEVGHSEDARLGALLETSAEVLTGLRTAFQHFEKGQEKAWQKSWD